jgi:uncharacterized protein (DUF362 family)
MIRRAFLTGVGGLAAASAGGKWLFDQNESSLRASVFVAKAASYQADLESIIRSGLAELGLGPAWARGKSILLKPNLVEPSHDAPHINTHPSVVHAAARVFQSWSAREVFVAEGQGHCRDTQFVLDESKLGAMLDEAKLDFVDLNHDDLFFAINDFQKTALPHIGLPATLKRADLIVSMPKLKTHHWAGVTLSLKNLFGVLPGIYYGWPKNVLHHAGIDGSILDIAAAVKPHLAIVDGIIGMEGDGPIMGTPINSGLLVMGTNLPAVDATCARLMGIDPWRVAYLRNASGTLGPISERHITQRGERIDTVAKNFELLPLPRFQILRA